MPVPFPEPTAGAPSESEVLLRYLDFFRAVVLDKLDGLSAGDLRGSRLPSGWSPLSLAKHLTFVERRWLDWGFAGGHLDDPWGDERDGRWFVAPEEPAEDVLAELRAQGATTRSIVERYPLDTVGRPGPRWDGTPPATLRRVLLHVMQEYARHAGQLDVVRELIDGRVGE